MAAIKVRRSEIRMAEQLTQAMVEAYLFERAPLPAGVTLASASFNAEKRTIARATFRAKGGRMVAGDWILDGTEVVRAEEFAAQWEQVP